jgi:hypothetical protein
MSTLLRRAQMWIPGLLAAPCLLACSLQDFGYLTSNRTADSGADSAGTGPDGAEAESGPALDGTTEATLDGGSGGGSDGATDARDAAAMNDTGSTGMDGTAPLEGGDDGGDAGTTGHATLVNPGFEQMYTGWSFLPTTAMMKYAYTQYAPTGGHTIDGLYELATWSQTDAFTVRVFQVLSPLPDGKYTFQGWFNCGVNNAAYVYSKNCGGPDQRTDIPVTQPTAWEQIGVTIDISGGVCEVGFYVDASATEWLNADAFSFGLAVPDGGPGDGGPGDGAGE